MNVYDKIDEILASQHMSRRKLAQAIEVAPSTFQSMMTRKRGLTFESAAKIADVLGVSTDVLYYGAEIDRDYENLCDVLNNSGLFIEESHLAGGVFCLAYRPLSRKRGHSRKKFCGITVPEKFFWS